jgi:hypothetical protein
MRLTPVEAGHRIEIPAEWAEELGLKQVAALERTASGILVSPYEQPVTWDEIFSEKLPFGNAAVSDAPVDVTRDDLLF